MMNAKVIYILKSRSVLSDGEKGPILNYGNAAALKLWAASWEQLTSMPSSETAEPQERATRAAFMSQIKEKGFADNYSGKLHPSCEYWEILETILYYWVVKIHISSFKRCYNSMYSMYVCITQFDAEESIAFA